MLKYGAYAFLDEGSGENIANTHIDEILKKNTGKSKDYKMTKGIYTLQKSTFNVHESGRSSATKSKNNPDINDPNFWEKVLPFEGFNPKQLMRKFKQKKADILKSKETQSKYMKDVSRCVKDLLEAKAVNDSITVDEEMFELLKKISKTKQFENKYRDKATVLLDKIIHFNDYQNTIIRDENDAGGEVNGYGEQLLGKRVLKRSAKQNVDYKDHGVGHKKREAKNRDKHSSSSSGDSEDEEGGGRKRLNRLCKDKKNEVGE